MTASTPENLIALFSGAFRSLRELTFECFFIVTLSKVCYALDFNILVSKLDL